MNNQNMNRTGINNPDTKVMYEQGNVLLFCTITAVVYAAIVLVIGFTLGGQICSYFFGTGHYEGFYNAGINLAVFMGPWGFGICGLVGLVITDGCYSNNKKAFRWYDYLSSIGISLLSTVCWLPLVLIFTALISVIVVVLIIAVIFIVLSSFGG